MAGLNTSLQIKTRGKVLDLSVPCIMGILNVTPDSFSDGGSFSEQETALQHIGRMVDEGAKIIDVGGESTRPGSDPVSEQEELDRVLPVLQAAIPEFPELFFSIDTTKFIVAEEALKAGAHLVNDISGLQKEPRLAKLCATYRAGFVLMHSQGDPKTMQQDPQYEDVVADVHTFFEQQIALARSYGLTDNIILDPGFGFGKTLKHNLTLLSHLEAFEDLQSPLLVGISRKSMIGQILDDRPVDHRLIGTVAAHYHAMMSGASIIRVHDVKEAHDSLRVFESVAQYRN